MNLLFSPLNDLNASACKKYVGIEYCEVICCESCSFSSITCTFYMNKMSPRWLYCVGWILINEFSQQVNKNMMIHLSGTTDFIMISDILLISVILSKCIINLIKSFLYIDNNVCVDLFLGWTICWTWPMEWKGKLIVSFRSHSLL